MSFNYSNQPWLNPGNPLSFQGPGQTFEGNYALKQFHSQHTSPNPICDFVANVDNGTGSRCGQRLPYYTNGNWFRR